MDKRIFVQIPATVASILLLTACSSKPDQIPAPVVREYQVNIPGENLSALSKITDGSESYGGPFGADNGSNLFFSVSQNGYSNIYKKDNPFAGSMIMKTSGKNHYSSPSYCAATDKVAFAGNQNDRGKADIYMMSASAGNALEQVTITPDAEEQNPCISSDGRLIVYEKLSYGTVYDTEIWMVNLQTKENFNLGHGRTPSFSPDGRNIVYVKYTADRSGSCIYTISINGNNPIQVTNTNLGFVMYPRYSPDGHRIIFQCMKQEKNDYDLYVIDSDGNHLMQLTINDSYDGQPYWAKDGSIYFVSDRGGKAYHNNIWRFKLDGVTTQSNTVVNKGNGGTAMPTYHTVIQGENITQIAQKYGVKVREIVEWNGLQTMTLSPGQKLIVAP